MHKPIESSTSSFMFADFNNKIWREKRCVSVYWSCLMAIRHCGSFGTDIWSTFVLPEPSFHYFQGGHRQTDYSYRYCFTTCLGIEPYLTHSIGYVQALRAIIEKEAHHKFFDYAMYAVGEDNIPDEVLSNVIPSVASGGTEEKSWSIRRSRRAGSYIFFIHIHDLTPRPRLWALEFLIFLSKKQNGKTKGSNMCVDGRKEWYTIEKGEIAWGSSML